jgi:hypothetical protein
MSIVPYLDPKIYIALRDHLAAMSGGYDVVLPGEDYPSSADTPFLLVQDVRLEPRAYYTGRNDPEDTRGIWSVTLMAPLNWTHTQMLGVAGLIRTHFSRNVKLIEGDAVVQITAFPYIATQAYRDGAYLRMPINIPWRAVG